MTPELESILQKQQAQIDSLRGEIRASCTKMESNSSSRADVYEGVTESYGQDKYQANELESLRKNIQDNEAKRYEEICALRDEMKILRSELSRYERDYRFEKNLNHSSGQEDPALSNESFEDNVVVNNLAPVANDSMEISTTTSGAAKKASHFSRGREWFLQKVLGIDVNDSEKKESTENIKITMESNPNENTQKPRPVIRRCMGGLITRYIIGSKRRNSDDALYVSNSFHIYTAAAISDHTCSPVFGWFVALLSKLIIVAQVVVLMALVLESGHPTCISHEECKIGECCGWKIWSGPPRCTDCGSVIGLNLNCSSVIDEINENEYTKYVNKIAWKTEDTYTESELMCFAQAYCRETDLSYSCEYLQYELFKSSLTLRLAIIFMSLLFCAPMIGYIQDAIVEERCLNYALKNYPMTHTMQLAAEVLRVAIRTRQILIPWLGTAAVLSIIIRDPLDIKNLMLNVLAVEVTLIADNLLAILVLPIFNKDAVVKLAQDAAHEGPVESPIWPRILGVSIGIVLITSIFYIESFLMFFVGETSTGMCSGMDNMIYSYIVHILPISALLVRRVGGLVIGKLQKMTWAKTILRFVAKTTTDFFVVYYVKLLSGGIVYRTTLPEIQLKVFYFIDKFKLYPSQEIWLSFILLAVFICGHALRIYSSWKPLRYLHITLYGESDR